MDFACLLIAVALVLVIIVALWKVFEKAGQPGWAAIVPFYNGYVLTCKVAQKEIIWFILFFVPIISIIAAIVVWIEVARKFGKTELFGVGLALLGFIFVPVLAFGDAEYEGGGRRKNRRDFDYEYEDDDIDDRPRKKREW